MSEELSNTRRLSPGLGMHLLRVLHGVQAPDEREVVRQMLVEEGAEPTLADMRIYPGSEVRLALGEDDSHISIVRRQP